MKPRLITRPQGHDSETTWRATTLEARAAGCAIRVQRYRARRWLWHVYVKAAPGAICNRSGVASTLALAKAAAIADARGKGSR